MEVPMYESNHDHVRRGRNRFGTSYPRKRAVAAGWRPFLTLAAFAFCAVASWAQTPPQLPEGNDPEGLRVVPRTHHGNERGAQSAGVDVSSEHDGDRRCVRAKRPDGDGDRLSGQKLPGASRSGCGGHPRERRGFDQGMASANGRIAAARSRVRSGWLGLVHGADGECAWEVRSQDAAIQRIYVEDAWVRAAWTRAR